MDPSSLFFKTPDQSQFNKAFLSFPDGPESVEIMGFCFSDCYNYRAAVLYMSPHLIQNYSAQV
jgi:hypothetical protein